MKKISSLFMIIVSLFVVSACFGDNNPTNNLYGDYRDLSNSEIIQDYEQYLSIQREHCDAQRELYFKDYIDNNDQFPSEGNSWWWGPLRSYTPEQHCNIYTSDQVVYSVSGQLENSPYLVSTVNFFNTGVMGGDNMYTFIQDNIINTLLGIESHWLEESISIYVNDSRIQLTQFFNWMYGSGAWDHITIVNSQEEHYDLMMSVAPTDEQIDDALGKNIPIYASYSYHYANRTTHQRFGVDLGYTYLDSYNDPINLVDIKEEYLTNNMPEYLELFNLLENGKINLTFSADSACAATGCTWSEVTLENGDTIQDKFYTPVNQLASFLSRLDNVGLDPFEEQTSPTLMAALVIADNIRSQIAYDFEAFTTLDDHTEFYRTLFTDRIISYARKDNVVSNDLGEYSPREDEIQLLSTTNDTVTFDLQPLTDMKSTGLYIKAGQTTTITRTDDHPDDIKLYINYSEASSHKIYAGGNNLYNRPHGDRSTAITLKTGESIQISTPKGGQLFVQLPNDNNGSNISISAENILHSPYLDTTDINSAAKFIQELANTPFNWVDIVTPYAEIHSRTDMMQTSLALEYYSGDIDKFVSDIETYYINVSYYMAGVLTSAVQRSGDVVEFFENLGLTTYTETNLHRRQTSHFYVDETTMGLMVANGVRMNGTNPVNFAPMESGRYFNPIGWGEIHEMGHTLQMSSMFIYNGSVSTEVSVNINAREATRLRAIANGEDYYNVSYSLETVYNTLKSDYNAGKELSEYDLWTNNNYFNYRLHFYSQLEFAADVTDFYPKLNILSRIFQNNNSSAMFDELGDLLGLTEYTYDERENMSSNDWMVIASSLIADRDLSDFFEGFGIYITDKAKEQINATTYSRSSIGKGIYNVPTKDVEPGYWVVDFIDYTNKEDYFVSLEDGVWE